MSYRMGVGGVSESMTHYDREGVQTIMIHDNDRGGGLKGMNIMAKSKQETHKKGRFLPGNTIISLSQCELG